MPEKKSSIFSRLRWVLIFPLFLSLGQQPALAQLPDYHLQFFDFASGVRPGTIQAVTRDHQGFLWILYPNSVQRYDGRSSRLFPMPGNDLGYIHCDENGRIWVGNNRQTWYFTEQQRSFKKVPLPTADSLIRRGMVFDMPNGELWQITVGGFYRLHPSLDSFVRIPDAVPVKTALNIRAFAQHEGTLFFISRGQLYRYKTGESRLDSLPERSIRKIMPVNSDSVLIHSWSTISYWYNFSKTTIHEALPPSQERPAHYKGAFSVRGLVNIGDSMAMIPSMEGLYEYNLITGKYRRLTLYYLGRPINSGDLANNIYADKDGYIWLTTVDGIARFPIQTQGIGLMRIKQLQDELPVGVDNIRSITEDKKGNLWLATGNGFVEWKRSSNKWDIHLPKEGSKTQLAFPSVRGIAYDGKYVILAPSDLGVWLYNPTDNSYRRPKYAHDSVRLHTERDFFDGLTTLKSGHHVFPGRDGLYVLDGRTYEMRQITSPADGENFDFAVQTRDGMIWVSTQGGLHLFNENMEYLQRINAPQPRLHITGGSVLNENEFLFARNDGMFTAKYENDKVVVNKFTSLVDGITMTSLYCDDKGFVWATSENGIYRIDIKKNKLNLFDFADNVQGYGFNLNSWFRSNDGILFVGGINGLNYLRPENFTLDNGKLRVFIEEVKSSKSDTVFYALDQKARLSYSDRSIEVRFASPYFNNPEKVSYRYKIEGLDDDWNYAGNNPNLRLTSLPPGHYKLRLEATLNQADWITSANVFEFRIRPPFWLTPWFITLVAAVLCLLTWLLIRNRNQKIREKQEELEAEQMIHYFSTGMDDQHSVDMILWEVARNCIGRLQFEDCVIYLYDEERKMLVQKAAHGPKSPKEFDIKSPIEIPLGKGITGSVALHGKAELVGDTSKDPRYIVDDEVRLSEIAVPMMSGGKLIGVIDCEHTRKGFFTKKHLTMLSTIASICANKIVKLQTEQEHRAIEQKLMATRQKMVEVEMQALRAQMNPHFIFNCLNSINRYIVKSDQATASLYLTRFAKLIRLILDNSNSQAVTLSSEMEALKLYIEMELIRFEKQFSYSIEVDEDVAADSIYMPPLIIQPYVENAIWHGLLHKEETGNLTIRLKLSKPGLLECCIEDNGVGRARAKELRSKSASTKKSLGMKLTQDRLQLLSREGESGLPVIEIEDLYHEDGSAAGTRVVLRIPV